jgi:transcriptional regulator of arginine metabolism
VNGRRDARQRAIRELVRTRPVGSQQELASLLAERGFGVTQATVSRDVADLGLAKVARGELHVYVLPEDVAPTQPARAPVGEARLRRILADHPVTVDRSGLILVLVGAPGSASAVAQAIDESGWGEPVGTLAGDNTVLVLFAHERALERWRALFEPLARAAAAEADDATAST